MIEAVLSERAIVNFDRGALEFFYNDGTSHDIHVLHITTIKVRTNEEGEYRLEVVTTSGAHYAENMDPDRVDQTMALVAEVQGEMATHRQ